MLLSCVFNVAWDHKYQKRQVEIERLFTTFVTHSVVCFLFYRRSFRNLGASVYKTCRVWYSCTWDKKAFEWESPTGNYFLFFQESLQVSFLLSPCIWPFSSMPHGFWRLLQCRGNKDAIYSSTTFLWLESKYFCWNRLGPTFWDAKK